MNLKSVSVEAGPRRINIDVPATAVVIEYEDGALEADPAAAVRKAIAEPLGSPPLSALAKPGMRVAIGFDDVTRPNRPAQTILPIVVEELARAGVKDRDIHFICASANHRKPTRLELANHLGAALFNRFWRLGNIKCHDCADQENLTYLGITESGRYVEHNRQFIEADLLIYQGNVSSAQGISFTGTGVCIGLASTRSIASSHSINSVPDPHAKKAAGGKKVNVKDEMSAFMEEATGKAVFYINAINGMDGRMIAVHAGNAAALKGPQWELAASRFTAEAPQADVLVVGLAQKFSYGSSDNSLISAAGTLTTPRYNSAAPILREGGVVIAVTPSNGWIDHRLYPTYQPAIDAYGRFHNALALVDLEDEFNNNAEYLHKYRHEHGYSPLHPFWLLYENEYALNRASEIIVAGTSNPAAYRALRMNTAQDFNAAWKIAKKHVGANPQVVVAPSFWGRPRVKFAVDPGKAS